MNRMKMLREETGKLQKEMASLLNVSQGTYSDWEVGRHMPDKDSLFKMADIYGTSLDYMLGYSNERKVDLGKSERLFKDYLQEKFGVAYSEEKRRKLEKILVAVVEALN